MGGVVAALVALAVGAVLLSSAYLARQIVADAVVLDEAELTLAANDVVVKALNQAVLLKEDEILEVADAATGRAALDEGWRTVEELQTRSDKFLEVADGDIAGLEAAIATALESATDVLTALETGEVVAAGDLLIEGLPDFEALRNRVGNVRNAARSNVEASEGLVGKTGSMVAFLMALLIPIAAILAYRQLASQQVRVAEVELDARIEAEQEIARSKDEFIGNVSHELRTPLTSIYGFTEVLLGQGLVDPESAMELIGLINLEASELGRMVEDMLTVARGEGQSLRYEVGIHSVRSGLQDALLSLPDGGGDIELDGPPVMAWFDPLRLRQIVRNLVSNARTHGGPVVRIDWEVWGDNVEIVVADNGPGIPDEAASRLFLEYFHEGKAPLTQGSLGMGLAAVRILAIGMNGSVRYERQGGWTRFVVSLPVADPAPVPDPAPGGAVDERPLPSVAIGPPDGS